MTADWFMEGEGRAIVPGSGGRHRLVVEPSLVTLVVRYVRARLWGLR